MLRPVVLLLAALIAQSAPIYDAIEPQLDALRQQPVENPVDLSSVAALERWRPGGAELIRRVLRVKTATVPAQIRRLSSTQLQGYRREKIDYFVAPGLRIPAFLFVPDGRVEPGPGIVLWHGHTHGGKGALAGIPPQTEHADLHHAGAVYAVRDGLVVLAPDVRGFGETGSWYDHQRVSGSMLLFGEVALGLFVGDAFRAMDVLAAEATVDPKRIGTGGMSLGGEIALFHAALDERVRTVVVQGFLSTFRNALTKRVHDICQYVPGLGVELEIEEVTALVAPRPMLFVTGRKDKVFPWLEATRAYFSIRKSYELLDAPRSVLLHRHSGDHDWYSPAALEWWRANL